MSSNEGPAVAGNPTDEPIAMSKSAHDTVYEASPRTETGVPAPGQGQDTASSLAMLRFAPVFMRPLILQSMVEDALPDWNTRGPDSFPSLHTWRLRGHALMGQPPNDIRVIDVERNGATIDKGEAAFEQADSILRLPLPQGSGVCRVIIGSPELGRVDKEFARRAVNLAGEKVRGASLDEAFEKTHFRSRISPGFDLARLRDLWIMEEVAWKPFWLPILSMRPPADKSGIACSPIEGCVRASGREVLYTQFSWILVQTIPLEGDRFLFLCTLPSRKFRATTPLPPPMDLDDIKRLTEGAASPSKEEIFEVLSRDQERSCRECFVNLLLSNDSATRLTDGKTDRLCQLLLLDVFRAVSETSVRLNRDMSATIASRDLPQLHNGKPQQILGELRSNCAIIESHFTNLRLAKRGAEHLFQWLSLDDAGEREPDGSVRTNYRWLKRVELALQADLDNCCSQAERGRDEWMRWAANQGEFIKGIESKNVERLTVLAAVFLPLGFGADLLGMQFRLRELGLILYDYLGLVVSASLLLFILYKVVPLLQFVFLAFRTDSPAQRKQSTFFLAKVFLQGNWLLVLVALWSILAASFIVGIVGDIPRSLVVLKYGGISWAALFLLYIIYALAWGWFSSTIWSVLGWNIVG